MTNATKSANSEKVLVGKTLGFRNVMNTEWPREAFLSRERWYGKTTYKVDVVCNRLNERHKEFKLKRDAVAYYDSLGKGV